MTKKDEQGLPFPIVDCDACNGRGGTEEQVDYGPEGEAITDLRGCEWCQTTGKVAIIPSDQARELWEIKQENERLRKALEEVAISRFTSIIKQTVDGFGSYDWTKGNEPWSIAKKALEGKEE